MMIPQENMQKESMTHTTNKSTDKLYLSMHFQPQPQYTNKHMRNPKFTNKEEYLQYRQDWKKEYMALSQTIHEKKWMRREYAKIAAKALRQVGGGQNEYIKLCATIDALIADNEKYAKLNEKYKNDRVWLEKQRKEAKAMMEELSNAKIEANRQYLASKQLINA